MVFGLSGAWGAGKTSTLHLIKNALDENHDEWNVVFFTPWAVNDPYALAEEFYRTIAAAMPENDKGEHAKKMLNAAAPALAAGAKAIFHGVLNRYLGEGTTQEAAQAFFDAAADSAGDIRVEEDPFAKRFEGIGKVLTELDIQVLVVVDDIDRLHHDELLAVMKAVRLLGRFDGVHYLLSYDTQTVTDVLTRSDLANGNARRAEQYLEKIVQYPFELPPIQLLHLRREFDRQLSTLARRGGFNLGSRDDGTLHLDVILEQLPLDSLTLRTVHRLFAQVDMVLSLVTDKSSEGSCATDEIDVVDTVLITYLRLEYPQLYRSLRSWKRDLTQGKAASATLQERTDLADQWRAKVATAVDPDGKNEDTTSRAYTLLRALFAPAIPRPQNDYRVIPDPASFQIRSSDYFDRYFAFGFPATDLRDAAVRAELIELISTGKLPEASLIHSHVANAETAPLLRTKVRTIIGDVLDEIGDVTHSGEAAIALTRAITDKERQQPHRDAWWAVAAFQLWVAANVGIGQEAAQDAITAYLDDFETDITITVLDVGRGQITPGTSLWIASEPVRDRVHSELVAALLDDRDLTEHGPLARYWYWASQQEGLIDRVRETVRQRSTATGGVDLLDLAARLVTVGHSLDFEQEALQGFDIETLIAIVPFNDWPADQLPDQLIAGIDVTDLSYRNRRDFAANVVFNALHKQPSSTR